MLAPQAWKTNGLDAEQEAGPQARSVRAGSGAWCHRWVAGTVRVRNNVWISDLLIRLWGIQGKLCAGVPAPRLAWIQGF